MTKRISVGLLAHVDAGKTTLGEALMFASGNLKKPGRVDHGSSFLDTDAQERARGITIFSKQAIMPYGDAVFTLLDTPGHVDFSAETERTLQVLDYAVLVVSGTDGVQSHTLTLWRLLERYRVPVFLFVNKMDLPGAEENLKRMKVLAEGMGCPVFPVSAATREGFEPLLDETAKMLETLPPILHYAEEEEEEPEQKLNNDFAIERDGEDYVVTGAGIERLMESVNFDDLESLNWFHRTLRRIGVIDALREQGAGEGSTVRIGEMEFDFVE